MPTSKLLDHNDTAKAIDAFNQSEFITQVAQLIKNCTPPKGIGINGYWGTGKTSALMQLHKALTGSAPHEYKKSNNQTIIPIWFEAWRYQSETTPIVALLQEIRAQLSIWQTVLNAGKKSGLIVWLGILAAMDTIIKIASASNSAIPASNLSKLPDIIKQLEDKNLETRLASHHTSNLLEQAIEALDKKGKNRLVIFIDDLDRCLPKVALQLLEGIKVYLNLNNCVLVFGMDQRQIEDALAKALDIDAIYPNHQAREYLEKICQDIHHLPIPNQYAKADYLLKLLVELDIDDRNQTNLTEIEQNQLTDKHLNNIKNVLYSYDCLPANPRKIKALSNRIALMLRKGCINKSPEPAEIVSRTIPSNTDSSYVLLIAMAIIYNFHRQLNEQLEKNPAYIREVVNFAKKPPNKSDDFPQPMQGIMVSINENGELPTNPSDGNVFRLHHLFTALDIVFENEIKPFLDSHK